MMGVFAAPPAALEVAVLAAVGTANASQSTIATGSVELAVGDRLVACFAHRAGSTERTHDSITSTGWTATWTKRPDILQTDATDSGTTRASMWDGVVTSAGTGAATGTLSGNGFQLALIVLRVPGMTAVDQQAQASNEVGTTVSATWAATPDAGALGIAFMVSQGNPATMGVTGLTAIADTNLSIGTALQVRAFQVLEAVPDPLAGTGALNNRAKCLVGLSVAGTVLSPWSDDFSIDFGAG